VYIIKSMECFISGVNILFSMQRQQQPPHSFKYLNFKIVWYFTLCPSINNFLSFKRFSALNYRPTHFGPFYTDDEGNTVLRKVRKHIHVDKMSRPGRLEASGTALGDRQISLLFMYQTMWHYIPEDINLHKPFILLLTASLLLSSFFQSPMIQNRSVRKGTDLWIYDRVSNCLLSSSHGCLDSRWVLGLVFLEVKRPTREFDYHHLLTTSVLPKGFPSKFLLHV
jgi:hypothetical protein